jgi:hypothetical protein
MMGGMRLEDCYCNCYDDGWDERRIVIVMMGGMRLEDCDCYCYDDGWDERRIAIVIVIAMMMGGMRGGLQLLLLLL